jgi:hypothetical protein
MNNTSISHGMSNDHSGNLSNIVGPHTLKVKKRNKSFVAPKRQESMTNGADNRNNFVGSIK